MPRIVLLTTKDEAVGEDSRVAKSDLNSTEAYFATKN